MKEKWEKKEEEWKNNPENASENGDEAQDENTEEKKCDKCSFLPSALMFCIQGNIVRVSFRFNFFQALILTKTFHFKL